MSEEEVIEIYGKSIWDMTIKEIQDNNLDDIWFNAINEAAEEE